MTAWRAAVITVSDTVAAGEAEDRSGPLALALLTGLGFSCAEVVVVADEVADIQTAILAAVAAADLVVTTGGTGLAPRDVTPAATRELLDREAPGIADLVRRAGADGVPTAVLSCGTAGLRDGCLVVNLPGSTGGVRDGIAALAPIVDHAIGQARGVSLKHG